MHLLFIRRREQTESTATGPRGLGGEQLACGERSSVRHVVGMMKKYLTEVGGKQGFVSLLFVAKMKDEVRPNGHVDFSDIIVCDSGFVFKGMALYLRSLSDSCEVSRNICNIDRYSKINVNLSDTVMI